MMLRKILIGVGALVAVMLVIGAILPKQSELRHRVKINAPKNTVWRILSDIEAVAHYNPAVQKAFRIGDQTGVGASRACELKDGSKVKESVTEIEDGKAITMALVESPWPVENMKWRTELTEEGGDTVVSQVLTYEMKLGPVGKLLNAVVMKGKMDSTLHGVFEGLKSYAESKK